MSSIPALLAQSSPDAVGALFILFFYLAVIVLFVAAFWKLFTKAGQPGWAAIIPIYNLYIMCKIAGRPGWWIILFFVPVVSLVIAIVVTYDLARSFGKGVGYTIGMIFLGFIFYPMLAFGSAQYQGPAAA